MSLTPRLLLALVLLASACGQPSLVSTDAGSDRDAGASSGSDAGSPAAADAGSPTVVNGTATALSCSSPPATASQVSQVVTGNTQFAVNAFSQLTNAANGGNVFYSPLSVSTALAMTYLGANGTTATQLAAALQFPSLSNTDLAAAFGTLGCELTADGQAAKGGQLDLANAVFGQTGASFQTPFLNLLQADLGAPLMSLDFQANPDGSREAIDQWVSQRTDAMIPQLLGPGTITTDTRMVLADALFFDQQWSTQFDPSATQPGAFQVTSAQSVMVPMMRGQVVGSYYADANVQAVELPFAGGTMAVDFFLPAAAGTTPDPTTGLSALEAQMTSSNLQTWTGGKSMQLQLQLPKFNVDFSADLVPTFQSLGVTDAFQRGVADFSGIDGQMDLWISLIQHEAVLTVGEAGITAAAATAVVIDGADGVATEPQQSVVINRPFTMVIRDVPTGTVLFVGQVTNPSL